MYTNIYNCSVSANCEMTPRCQAQKSLFTYTYHTRNKTWKYSTVCRIRTAKADQIFATTTKCCTGQGNERLHLVLDTQIYMYLYLYIFIDI